MWPFGRDTNIVNRIKQRDYIEIIATLASYHIIYSIFASVISR